MNVAITCSAVRQSSRSCCSSHLFTVLTDYSRKTLKKSKYGADREFIVSVNDALGYGETATLTTGLLVIPVCVLLAFILPGNVVVPLMVLPYLPYMVEVPVCLSNGNVIKSWIMACIVFSCKDTYGILWAGTFTEIAAGAGFEAATQALEGGTLIIGFIMSNCTAGFDYDGVLNHEPSYYYCSSSNFTSYCMFCSERTNLLYVSTLKRLLLVTNM